MDSKGNVAVIREQWKQDVESACTGFYDALNRLFSGDFSGMTAAWSHGEDVLLMGPFGGRQVGWKQVEEQLLQECQLKLGGRLQPTELNTVMVGELAIVSCRERGTLPTANGPQLAISHRATHIFRNENGGWKLIFRQTDPSPRLQGLYDEEDCLITYGQESCDD